MQNYRNILQRYRDMEMQTQSYSAAAPSWAMLRAAPMVLGALLLVALLGWEQMDQRCLHPMILGQGPCNAVWPRCSRFLPLRSLLGLRPCQLRSPSLRGFPCFSHHPFLLTPLAGSRGLFPVSAPSQSAGRAFRGDFFASRFWGCRALTEPEARKCDLASPASVHPEPLQHPKRCRTQGRERLQTCFYARRDRKY